MGKRAKNYKKKLLKSKEIRERKIRPKNFMKISRDWLPEIGSSKCHCIKIAKIYYLYDWLKQLPVNETEKALRGQLKVLCFKNGGFFLLLKYSISKNLLL